MDNHTYSAGKIAGIILGVSASMSVCLFIVCFWKRKKKRHKNSSINSAGSNEDVPLIKLPMALSMDEKNTYMDTINTGKEVRQYVRIHVIGRDRVGKTSLVHRLLFIEDGSYDGKSTDGIEVERKCQIRRNDGKWFVGEVETEKKAIIRRIHLALNTKQKETNPRPSQLPTEENRHDTEKKKNEQKNNSSQIEKKQNCHETLISQENNIETEPLDVVSKIYDDPQHASYNLADSSSDGKKSSTPHKRETQQNIDLKNPEPVPNSNVLLADQITEMMVIKMDEILDDAQTETEKMKSEGLIQCGIWDFAGQKDYYATHQTFFTPHAIYLLVADIKEDINLITHNEDDCKCIGDYIDFWFDSVHCFCKDRLAKKLCPPVIMVYTGTDKFEKVKDKKKEYEKNIRQVFGGTQKKFDHRRGIYFISNTNFRAEDVKEIKRLRKHISDIALEMNYFAEKLPTKWIRLENALEVLKDLSIHVYSWDNLLKISHKNLVEEEELLGFLNYQHKIGNIIFFNDIREYIILRPDWLVKCFRCLVCDCNNEKRNYNLICPTAWNELKTSGELPELLINQLFQKEPELKFLDHKTHLLNVMEKFDIIIKPKFKDTGTDKCHKSDSYYLPCMIEKTSSYKSVMEAFINNTSDVTITPWLVLEFEFLPLAYFNHILFHYIRNYEVCEINTKKVEQKAIYRGKAVFSLDDFRVLIICFSHNAISVQIWEWGDIQDNVYKTVLNELCGNIEIIQGKLGQTISYTIKAKCCTGDYSKSEGRITLDISSERERYMCKEHKNTHSMEDIKHSWLPHATEMKCGIGSPASEIGIKVENTSLQTNAGTTAIEADIQIGIVMEEKDITANKSTKEAEGEKEYTLQCENCDTLLLPDSKFCHKCDENIDKMSMCSKCNNVVSKENNYCPKCGEKLRRDLHAQDQMQEENQGERVFRAQSAIRDLHAQDQMQEENQGERVFRAQSAIRGPESLAEVKQLKKINEEGSEKFMEHLNKTLDKWKKEKVKFGLVGGSTMGKSSFANVLTGRTEDNENRAKTSAGGNTTLSTTEYSDARQKSISFIDFPGYGTPAFTYNAYFLQESIDTLDYVLIFFYVVSSYDIRFAKSLDEKKKKFCFVRTKLDIDIDSAKYDNPEDTDPHLIAETLRQTAVDSIEKQGLLNPIVFVISNRRKDLGHFPNLLSHIEQVLHKEKYQALIYEISTYTRDAIKRKHKLLCDRINSVTMQAVVEEGEDATDFDSGNMEEEKKRIKLQKTVQWLERELLFYIETFELNKKTSIALIGQERVRKKLKFASLLTSCIENYIADFITTKLDFLLDKSRSDQQVVADDDEEQYLEYPFLHPSRKLLSEVLDGLQEDAFIIFEEFQKQEC